MEVLNASVQPLEKNWIKMPPSVFKW